MLLLRRWGWTIVDYKMLRFAWYSLDLPQWLGGLAQNLVFGLSDLAWLSRFLQSEWNFLNHLVTILWSPVHFHTTNGFGCFCSIMAQFELVKFSYIVQSFVWLLNHSCNAQPVSAPATTILLITACAYHILNCFSHIMCCKIACTKIL